MRWDPIVFPAHALLIVEERLKDQEGEGVRMPEGMPLDELALRVLIAAALTSSVEPHLSPRPSPAPGSAGG